MFGWVTGYNEFTLFVNTDEVYPLFIIGYHYLLFFASSSFFCFASLQNDISLNEKWVSVLCSYMLEIKESGIYSSSSLVYSARLTPLKSAFFCLAKLIPLSYVSTKVESLSTSSLNFLLGLLSLS